MAPSLEKHLFKTSRAVFVDGVSETATSVGPLDILIKTESEGIFARRPVLESAGTMVQLGSAASCEVTRERLSTALSNFGEGRGDKLIKWTREHGVIMKKVSSASSLMASLLSIPPFAQAGAHFVRAKGLNIKIENPETASFEKNKLLDLVVNEKLWKPDINNGRLQWSSHGARCVRKLWVVHQVLYASKLEFTAGDSVSGKAQVCSLVPAMPGLGLEASSGSANELVVKVGKNSKFPGKFMYAFRAVRFHFDAEGNLVTFQNNVGKVMPVTRGNADGGPYADEHEQIRELFEVPPTESDFEDDDDDDDGDEDGEEDEDEGDEDDVAEEDEEEWDGKPLLIRDGARDEMLNLSER